MKLPRRSRWRALTTAAAALLLGAAGCQHKGADTAGNLPDLGAPVKNSDRYKVRAESTPLYHYGPQQLGGSDMDLKKVGSSRVDLQACKLEYSIVSPK